MPAWRSFESVTPGLCVGSRSRSRGPSHFRDACRMILLAVVLVLPLAALAWSWVEAGWVRFRTVDVRVPGLPPELEGLRIAHLSDFHLGLPSRGARAVERAADWVAERRPDLTLVT